MAAAAGFLAGGTWILLIGFVTKMEPRASRRLALIGTIVAGIVVGLSILFRYRPGIAGLTAQAVCFAEWQFCVWQQDDAPEPSTDGST